MSKLVGSRGYGISLETFGDYEQAPRQEVFYTCPKGHRFEVPFAADAECPPTWECRLHGTESEIVDGSEQKQVRAKPPRTHWDMLRERRTDDELKQTLLDVLVERRRWTRAAAAQTLKITEPAYRRKAQLRAKSVR
ncbi:hypothetical protein GCM10010470_55050 [Saccharopolyspora taberi]|uniref:RNA polymerase-binding protein RbpA n=1 Tax=Saccharopolyspora taberi TaxID=60895 RepID=A0ABN3VM42_9PSEU